MTQTSPTYTDRWLLPEGVEELLPPEAERLEQLRRRLLDCYRTWGYELVMPPLIEYLESLLTGVGNDLGLQTFKLTDELTGRLMGVRADMTPQVARIEAHRLGRAVPVRLCYLGTVLRTRPDGPGGTRSPLQVGAELYGDAGAESDVEVLSLMLETLRLTGFQQVHVDLGHVGIFRGLSRQAGLTEAQEYTLFEALQRKAQAEIDALLAAWALPATVSAMLAALADLNGGEELLPRARSALATAAADVQRALERLDAIAAGVARRVPGVALYFDLAELRGYHYHTGPVFAAYVPGHGQAVAQGGRYDDIGAVFGHARPATGFSADLRTLVSLLPDDPAPRPRILAPCIDDAALQSLIARLRAAGECVIDALPGAPAAAAALGCQREIVQQDGQWTVAPASGPDG